MYLMRRSQHFNVNINAYKNMQTYRYLGIRAGMFFNTSLLYNTFLLKFFLKVTRVAQKYSNKYFNNMPVKIA